MFWLYFPNLPILLDESPERREGFNERDEESASFSKYSNKSPTKIHQGEGFDLAEGEEGMEDGSPMHRPIEESGEENEAMRRYEEQEIEILQYCEENNCLWEDKDFPPINSSIYTVIPDFKKIIFIKYSGYSQGP